MPTRDAAHKKRPRHLPETLERARENRRNLTRAEAALWNCLRARRLDGLKFTKQFVLEPYIADFACRSAKLIVEVDGESHDDRGAYDARRTAFLERSGFRVIRFSNDEVLEAMEGVLETIRQAAKS